MGIKPFVLTERSLARMKPNILAKKLNLLKKRNFVVTYENSRAKKLTTDLLKKMGASRFLGTGWTLKDLGIDPSKLWKTTTTLQEELKKYKLTVQEFEALLKKAGKPVGQKKKIEKKMKDEPKTLDEALKDYGLTEDQFKKAVDLWKKRKLGKKGEKEEEEPEEEQEGKEDDDDEPEEEGDDDAPPPPDDDDDEPTFKPQGKPGSVEPKQGDLGALTKDEMEQLKPKEKIASDELLINVLKSVSNKYSDKFSGYLTAIKEQLYKDVRTNETFKKRDEFDKLFGKGKIKQGTFQKFLKNHIENPAKKDLKAFLEGLYDQLTGVKKPSLFNGIKKQIASCLFDPDKLKAINDEINTIIISLAASFRSGSMGFSDSDSDQIAEDVLTDLVKNEKRFKNVKDPIIQLIREIDYLRVNPKFTGFNKVFGKTRKISGPIINSARTEGLKSYSQLRSALKAQFLLNLGDFEKFEKEKLIQGILNKVSLQKALDIHLAGKKVAFDVALSKVRSITGMRNRIDKLSREKKNKYSQNIDNILNFLKSGKNLDTIIKLLQEIVGKSKVKWQDNIKKVVASEWEKGRVAREVISAFLEACAKGETEQGGKYLYDALVKISEIKKSIENNIKNNLPFITPDVLIKPIKKYLIRNKDAKQKLDSGEYYKMMTLSGFLLEVMDDIQNKKEFIGSRIERLIDVLWSFKQRVLQSTAKEYQLLKNNKEFIDKSGGNLILQTMAKYLQDLKTNKFIALLSEFVKKDNFGLEKSDKFKDITEGLKQAITFDPIEKKIKGLTVLDEGKSFYKIGVVKKLPVSKLDLKGVHRKVRRERSSVLHSLRGQFKKLIILLKEYLQSLKTTGKADKTKVLAERKSVIETLKNLKIKGEYLQAIEKFLEFTFLK